MDFRRANAQKAQAIAEAKAVLRDRNIDSAMETAECIYKQGVEQEDPYAMHKAVESLPEAILIDILARRTRHELERVEPEIEFTTSEHSSSSMLREGTYPPGTTREQVESVVKGTFGGRFTYFGNGKFSYVAYTD